MVIQTEIVRQYLAMLKVIYKADNFGFERGSWPVIFVESFCEFLADFVVGAGPDLVCISKLQWGGD